VSVPCKLCERRRAKRHCPGIGGDICPSCCGAERENTIDCPLDCEHLREARLHERAAPLEAEQAPNNDIRLSEDFIREQEALILWLSASLSRAMEREKAVDSDAREALDALIQTYRTLESGLIYETRPQNPYAAGIQEALKTAIEEMRKELAAETGLHTLRDKDILGVLVFLQRVGMRHNNGRRRGRAFLDFLRTYFHAEARSGVVVA
jgi:hypothetical protein